LPGSASSPPRVRRGGFAVDYWAFRKAGATEKEAGARAVGLGLLEYVVLSIAALGASLLLFLRLDGSASDATTLPSLTIVPVAGGVMLRRLLSSPREHGMGVVGNAIYWGGDIACLWAAMQIVDLHISLSMLVLTYAGGYVLTRRSLPAGGAGLVEAALTLALVWTGLPFARALVAVVIYRLFNFWLPIVPALLIMPSIKQLRHRFQQAERVT